MPPILAREAFLKATATSFFFFASLNCFVLLPLYSLGLADPRRAPSAPR